MGKKNKEELSWQENRLKTNISEIIGKYSGPDIATEYGVQQDNNLAEREFKKINKFIKSDKYNAYGLIERVENLANKYARSSEDKETKKNNIETMLASAAEIVAKNGKINDFPDAEKQLSEKLVNDVVDRIEDKKLQAQDLETALSILSIGESKKAKNGKSQSEKKDLEQVDLQQNNEGPSKKESVERNDNLNNSFAIKINYKEVYKEFINQKLSPIKESPYAQALTELSKDSPDRKKLKDSLDQINLNSGSRLEKKTKFSLPVSETSSNLEKLKFEAGMKGSGLTKLGRANKMIQKIRNKLADGAKAAHCPTLVVSKIRGKSSDRTR